MAVHLTGTYDRDDVLLLLDEIAVAPQAEYIPSPTYLVGVRRLIDRTAREVAELCATLGDSLLKRRGHRFVLVSIVRAGVPIGILLRRWLRVRHGIVVPHYGISIAAGVVDESAVRWVCERHSPHHIQFLDAWTSKGTVQETLRRAGSCWQIAHLDPSLAVLSDPGYYAAVCATRADFLLPTACLGAAMSGQLSATSAGNATPGRFHRAAFVREMATVDLTNAFLEAVTSHFESLARRRPSASTRILPTVTRARLRGCDHAVALVGRHGADDLDLVNVGISETTRAFFRRRPRLLIVNPRPAGPELRNPLQLARERSVPVVTDEAIPFQAALI